MGLILSTAGCCLEGSQAGRVVFEDVGMSSVDSYAGRPVARRDLDQPRCNGRAFIDRKGAAGAKMTAARRIESRAYQAGFDGWSEAKPRLRASAAAS